MGPGKRPDVAVSGQCLGIRGQGRCQKRREGGTDKAAHPRGARLTLGHGGCLMADRCWPVSTRVVILEIVTPHCAQRCNYLLRSKEKKKNISFIITSNRHKQKRKKKDPPLIKKPLINHHASTCDLAVVFKRRGCLFEVPKRSESVCFRCSRLLRLFCSC